MIFCRCVSEALIAVSLLSSDTIFVNPSGDDRKAAAAEAHRLFYSREGDITTLMNVFIAWNKAKKDRNWCVSHFVNHKSLQNAANVRHQLEQLLIRMGGIDVKSTCYPEREPFLKCLASGLFLQVARRNDGDVSIQTPANYTPDKSKFTFSTLKSTAFTPRFLDPSVSVAPYRTYRTSGLLS